MVNISSNKVFVTLEKFPFCLHARQKNFQLLSNIPNLIYARKHLKKQKLINQKYGKVNIRSLKK